MKEIKSIAEQLLYTTVRIEQMDGTRVVSMGTGFIFNYVYKEANYPFIVTNGPLLWAGHLEFPSPKEKTGSQSSVHHA